MHALEISDLTVEYRSGDYVVRPIDGLDLTAEDGELVVLLGPSGCGKTTLLSCLGGILKPAAGSIRVGGTEVTTLVGDALHRYRRSSVGFVFQAFNLIPSLSALENVAMPLLVSGRPRAEAMARARELLDAVGLADRASHRPGSLSGGQQQRVGMARGLAQDPPVLIADEPTANLDYIQAETVIRLLRELTGPGRLTVVSTHDHRVVPLADRVVELAQPAAEEQTPAHEEQYQPGEVIFRQGSRGALVYVVEDGEVEIVRELVDGGREPLARLRAGRYFGELGPVLGFPRTATARALTHVTLTAYGVREFTEKVLGRTDDPALPPV